MPGSAPRGGSILHLPPQIARAVSVHTGHLSHVASEVSQDTEDVAGAPWCACESVRDDRLREGERGGDRARRVTCAGDLSTEEVAYLLP